MTNLDFSDLRPNQIRVTSGSFFGQRPGFLRKNFVWPIVIFSLVIGGFIVQAVIAALVVGGDKVAVIGTATILGAIIIIFVAVFFANRAYNRRIDRFFTAIEAFMTKNNFSAGRFAKTHQTSPPFITGLGSRNATALELHGKIKDYPFDLYAYKYYVRHKNGETEHPFTVFYFPLSKALPHLVLDSRKNDGLISSIPRFFKDEQRIELEGDFNQYFDFFAPDGYEIEALDIMSPDFMQMLMDFHSTFDIEINGQDVYIISKGVNYDKKSLEELFTAAQVLMDKFTAKLNVWSMTAMQKQLPELGSYIGENAIRIGNVRLSTASFLIPLFALMIAARASELRLNIYILGLIFLVSCLVMVVARKAKFRRG